MSTETQAGPRAEKHSREEKEDLAFITSIQPYPPPPTRPPPSTSSIRPSKQPKDPQGSSCRLKLADTVLYLKPGLPRRQRRICRSPNVVTVLRRRAILFTGAKAVSWGQGKQDFLLTPPPPPLQLANPSSLQAEATLRSSCGFISFPALHPIRH